MAKAREKWVDVRADITPEMTYLGAARTVRMMQADVQRLGKLDVANAGT